MFILILITSYSTFDQNLSRLSLIKFQIKLEFALILLSFEGKFKICLSFDKNLIKRPFTLEQRATSNISV